MVPTRLQDEITELSYFCLQKLISSFKVKQNKITERVVGRSQTSENSLLINNSP